MSTQQFHATGLTCGHCAAAVTEEVGALEGVGDVAVEVVEGGASLVTVTGVRELTDEEVAAALEEAGGYALVGRD
jgi:copper chaperone